MIECPFCGETIDEEQLIYEFSWGDVATFFYNRKKLTNEPPAEYSDRSFYVKMNYDWRGRPILGEMSTFVNPEKHPGKDPLNEGNGYWSKIVQLLSGRNIFEVECGNDDKTLPIGARILPMAKHDRKGQSNADGISTGMFCPICEQQLKPEVMKAKTEIRIVLSGRPGSGKTVYVTQMISELMKGRLAQAFNIEPANHTVHQHYTDNKNRLKAFSGGFVLATNPGTVQSPYIYLMNNGKSTIRLIIQDIAGEDTENRTKYSKAVRKADLLLYFVDPWHIEEVRAYHKRNDDLSNAIVDRSTNGRYNDLTGVFQQMMNAVDRNFTSDKDQLAGILLIKGDYLNPPMLARGNQPECEMMQKPISFSDPAEMEFSIGIRSSFIRQCMQEWESTRTFAREVESKYSAHNIRYFVASALGQSTHLRQKQTVTSSSNETNSTLSNDNPDAQFNVENKAPARRSSMASTEEWDYDEQVLESAARPEHVIDPIFWCLKRKGIKF